MPKYSSRKLRSLSSKHRNRILRRRSKYKPKPCEVNQIRSKRTGRCRSIKTHKRSQRRQSRRRALGSLYALRDLTPAQRKERQRRLRSRRKRHKSPQKKSRKKSPRRKVQRRFPKGIKDIIFDFLPTTGKCINMSATTQNKIFNYIRENTSDTGPKFIQKLEKETNNASHFCYYFYIKCRVKGKYSYNTFMWDYQGTLGYYMEIVIQAIVDILGVMSTVELVNINKNGLVKFGIHDMKKMTQSEQDAYWTVE